MRHLAIAIQDIDGNENHAQFDAGEIQIDYLDRVREINAQAIAFGEPARSKGASHAIAASVDLSVAPGWTSKSLESSGIWVLSRPAPKSPIWFEAIRSTVLGCRITLPSAVVPRRRIICMNFT